MLKVWCNYLCHSELRVRSRVINTSRSKFMSLKKWKVPKSLPGVRPNQRFEPDGGT